MQRRHFLQRCAAAAAIGTGLPLNSAAAGPIDVVAAIKALRIPSGPWAGGYEVAPNGRLNWYFASLGLLPVVQWMTAADREAYVRPYLDLYLRSVTSRFTIEDVDFPVGRADPGRSLRVPSDSDDSYAATLLSLAARYYHASNDTAWWNANRRKLKDIAYFNLAKSVKPNGLTSVFQPPRSQSNSIGYLMDNCEVYRGLRDFASALREGGEDAEAAYYDSFATGVGRAVAGLYVPATGAFRAGDAYAQPETSFYPGTTCQVFPQAFGVVEAQAGFDAAWSYLDRHHPGWDALRYDTYPWAVLGAVAARRGQRARAAAQMRAIEAKFAASREVVTINELGFYQRMTSLLSSAPEV